MTEEDITLEVPLWVYPLSVLAILITVAAAGYIYLGFLVAAPVILAGSLALLAWYGTTYRYPRKRQILPLYIALVILLLLQGFEQYYFDYPTTMKILFPIYFEPPVVFNDAIFLSNFVLAGTVLFLVGAVGIFFHHPLGNYVGWFLTLQAVIGGFVLFMWPLLSGQGLQYLPGMVVAPFVIILGIVGIIRLFNKTEGVQKDEEQQSTNKWKVVNG